MMASRSPSEATELGLRAEYQGSNALLISWDRAAAPIISARSAAFTIADGPRTRTFQLSPRELQTGSILYRPGAEEVSVELQVSSEMGGTASQSIRIIGANASKAAVPAGERAAARMEKTPRRAPQVSFESPAGQSPPGLEQQRSVTMIDAPDVASSSFGSQEPLTLATALPPAPAQPSLESRETPPAPVESPGAARELRPAVPIVSPQPRMPPTQLPPHALDRPVDVQVEVSINAAGRVTNARLSSDAGIYGSMLAPSAINTARLWRFRPATVGGQPVESKMVLTFRYSHAAEE
jgi:protein TonB